MDSISKYRILSVVTLRTMLLYGAIHKRTRTMKNLIRGYFTEQTTMIVTVFCLMLVFLLADGSSVGCLYDGTMYNRGDTVMIQPCLATMTCLGNYIYSDPVSLGGVCPDNKRAVDGQTGCLFNGRVYSANESIIIQPCLAEMTCLGYNSYSNPIPLGGDCRTRRNVDAHDQSTCLFDGRIYSKGETVIIPDCLAKFTCLGNNLISQPIQLHGQC